MIQYAHYPPPSTRTHTNPARVFSCTWYIWYVQPSSSEKSVKFERNRQIRRTSPFLNFFSASGKMKAYHIDPHDFHRADDKMTASNRLPPQYCHRAAACCLLPAACCLRCLLPAYCCVVVVPRIRRHSSRVVVNLQIQFSIFRPSLCQYFFLALPSFYHHGFSPEKFPPQLIRPVLLSLRELHVEPLPGLRLEHHHGVPPSSNVAVAAAARLHHRSVPRHCCCCSCCCCCCAGWKK